MICGLPIPAACSICPPCGYPADPPTERRRTSAASRSGLSRNQFHIPTARPTHKPVNRPKTRAPQPAAATAASVDPFQSAAFGLQVVREEFPFNPSGVHVVINAGSKLLKPFTNLFRGHTLHSPKLASRILKITHTVPLVVDLPLPSIARERLGAEAAPFQYLGHWNLVPSHRRCSKRLSARAAATGVEITVGPVHLPHSRPRSGVLGGRRQHHALVDIRRRTHRRFLAR